MNQVSKKISNTSNDPDDVSTSKENTNGIYNEIIKIKVNDMKSTRDLKFESG